MAVLLIPTGAKTQREYGSPWPFVLSFCLYPKIGLKASPFFSDEGTHGDHEGNCGSQRRQFEGRGGCLWPLRPNLGSASGSLYFAAVAAEQWRRRYGGRINAGRSINTLVRETVQGRTKPRRYRR